MDILSTYFAEHLSEDEGGAPSWPTVARMVSVSTRYVLFKVGHIRFALASTDIASLTRAPDSACAYVSGGGLVPKRYHGSAQVGPDHDTYIHVAGTRLGIGPCRADGETVLEQPAAALTATSIAEPWIGATLAQPPSLVLDKEGLIARLHALSIA